jgi:hypothetical protein
MSSALFNPPTPRNWIYMIIIFSALLIVTLMNSCKIKKVDIDKTEIKTDFSKKDSINDMSKKTEQQTLIKLIQIILIQRLRLSILSLIAQRQAIAYTKLSLK